MSIPSSGVSDTQAVAEARLLAALVGDLEAAVLRNDRMQTVSYAQMVRESAATLLGFLEADLP